MAELKWESVGAALFDLDGVITPTAEVHMRAWAQMFNDFLGSIPGQAPYTSDDYFAYVDGKPRMDGVRSLLQSRNLALPDGTPDDPPEADTVGGLGNRKNVIFSQILADEGIVPYPGSIELVDYLRDRRVRCAIVSSSKNARVVLTAAGVIDKFEFIVDGQVAAEENLAGKPAPDTYLYAARHFGLDSAQSVVFEDAISGVQSGRAGHFQHVVGVDRGAGAQALRDNGADIVVEDLAELVPKH